MIEPTRGRRNRPRSLTTNEAVLLEDAVATVTEARNALDRIVNDLFQAGVSQSTLAERLGVTQQAVYMRIRRYRERRDGIVTNQSRRIKTTAGVNQC